MNLNNNNNAFKNLIINTILLIRIALLIIRDKIKSNFIINMILKTKVLN